MKEEITIGWISKALEWFWGLFLGLALFSFVSTASAQEGVPIQIESVEVTGNSLIVDEEIDGAMGLLLPYQLEGEGISSLSRFTDAITDLYHKRGYFLAQAYLPEQAIEGGVLNISVVEGVLGEVAVSGNSVYASSFIKGHFGKVKKGASHQSFERALLILNDYSDLKATGLFQPGSAPGSTDLSVSISDVRPVHYTLGYNNFGSPLVSRHRFEPGVEIGNLLQYGSLLTFRGVIGSPVSRAKYGRVMYGMPINFDGTRVNVRYGSGDFDVGKQLAVHNITMRTSGFGVSVSHSFIKRRLVTLSGEAGIDAQDFRQTFRAANFKREDRLRVLQVGLDYEKQTERGRNMGRVVVRKGLGELLGGMRDNFPEASRSGADGGFSKGGIEAARFHKITDKVSLIARGEVQVSGDTLVVGEQFSLGGPDSVRGYSVGEYLSDSGYRFNLEMRISPLEDKGLMQAVVFIDSGKGSIRRLLPGEVKEGSLTGIGFGVRAHKD
jgi:hemolysin activation/secretion protein